MSKRREEQRRPVLWLSMRMSPRQLQTGRRVFFMPVGDLKGCPPLNFLGLKTAQLASASKRPDESIAQITGFLPDGVSLLLRLPSRSDGGLKTLQAKVVGHVHNNMLSLGGTDVPA